MNTLAASSTRNFFNFMSFPPMYQPISKDESRTKLTSHHYYTVSYHCFQWQNISDLTSVTWTKEAADMNMHRSTLFKIRFWKMHLWLDMLQWSWRVCTTNLTATSMAESKLYVRFDYSTFFDFLKGKLFRPTRVSSKSFELQILRKLLSSR